MIIEINLNIIEKKVLKFFPNFKIDNNPYQKVLAYKKDNEIIGFIIYSIIYERAEIDYLAVEEEYRGSGVAKDLLDKMYNSLKDCESVSLEVNSTNKRAIKFYKKNGFKIVSTRKKYYEKSDGLLMVKEVI